LRQIHRLAPAAAIALLDGRIRWARRCRLAPFVKLARTITKRRTGIVAAIKHSLSNARVEALNTQIRMDHAPRLWVPQPRRADRPCDAVPRCPLPTAPTMKQTTHTTHGTSEDRNYLATSEELLAAGAGKGKHRRGRQGYVAPPVGIISCHSTLP